MNDWAPARPLRAEDGRPRKGVFSFRCEWIAKAKAVCGTPACARVRSVALVRVCEALPVRREMGWGRWMGGRFTLLLSLCSLLVCLNLPTTIRPLITRHGLLPPSSHCLFHLPPSFYSSSTAPVIHLSCTIASPPPSFILWTLPFPFLGHFPLSR